MHALLAGIIGLLDFVALNHSLRFFINHILRCTLVVKCFWILKLVLGVKQMAFLALHSPKRIKILSVACNTNKEWTDGGMLRVFLFEDEPTQMGWD